MADVLAYIFSWSAWWLWLLLLLALALIVYARHDSSFALTDLSYTFPVLGRLHRFSKDYSESSHPGWLNVEHALCRDYARHISAMSKAQFENNVHYLKKTYDHGRRPLPAWALGTLAMLVVLEGLGFSYLLSAQMAIEGSEDLRQILTVAIVIVLAIILVWVTHAAGHQLYRTGLLRSCFREFQTSKAKAFSSQIVSLDDNQWVDSAEPAHVQCANRVITKPGDRGTHFWVWLAALLILVIGVGSYKLRTDTLHSVAADDSGVIADLFDGGGEGESGAPPGPAETPAPGSPETLAAERAALTSFAMLAVIFMVTQIAGMSLGFWYGFAGKQSKAAYRSTRGAADYETYWSPVQRRINLANLRLDTLHRLLEQYSPRPLEFEKHFIDFIREEKKRGAPDLHLPPGEPKALPKPFIEGPEASAEAADDAGPPEEPNGLTTGEVAGAAVTEPPDDALDRWDIAADEEGRLDVLAALPADSRDALVQLLRRRKAGETAREALRAQHKDLLQ